MQSFVRDAVVLTGPRRMSISDVHFLIARARLEADNPAFKVNSKRLSAGSNGQLI